MGCNNQKKQAFLCWQSSQLPKYRKNNSWGKKILFRIKQSCTFHFMGSTSQTLVYLSIQSLLERSSHFELKIRNTPVMSKLTPMAIPKMFPHPGFYILQPTLAFPTSVFRKSRQISCGGSSIVGEVFTIISKLLIYRINFLPSSFANQRKYQQYPKWV